MSKKNKAADLIKVKQSSVHGKGVFAIVDIPKKTKIIEYTGERISWDVALDRHPHDPKQPNHTFYFGLDDGSVIDAKFGGNAAIWINHSCHQIARQLKKTLVKNQKFFCIAKKILKLVKNCFMTTV